METKELVETQNIVEEPVVTEDNEQKQEDDKNTSEVVVQEADEDIVLSSYDTLVLSGGGSKGILALGALQYAYDNYHLNDVKTYIGTSIGAIICFFLVIGYTPSDIMIIICTNRIMERLQNFNIVSMINGLGASSFSGLQEHLEKITIAKIGYLPTLNDLYTKYGKTFICCTYNLTTASSEYLSHECYPDLPCITALRMSANLPLVFEKYKYNGSYYIDGGLSDNFPIDIAENKGNKILGILLENEKENFNKIQDMDIIEYIYNLINIPSVQSIEYKIKLSSDKCTIIRLNYENIKMFDFTFETKTKLNMFSRGYQKMKSTLEM